MLSMQVLCELLVCFVESISESYLMLFQGYLQVWEGVSSLIRNPNIGGCYTFKVTFGLWVVDLHSTMSNITKMFLLNTHVHYK